MELRELEKTKEMWNLFLLAMTDFQKMDQNTIDSWFQIAGIHGMPWADWDGVHASTADRSLNTGYCTHNNLLFSTWHRPYLVLFEQKLQKIATGIANKFPSATRAKYQDAAKRLRLPFWDWAKNVPTTEPVVPTSLSVEKVSVTLSDGSSAQIDNPLYDYNFHPLDHTQINGTFQQTIRASQDFNDNATLDSRLRSILRFQRADLFKILSQYQKFDHFSSNAQCGENTGRLGSIESVHGPIHVKNFPGHMSPSSVTAFDPMFWFHHANVDRQVALYQAVFPTTYVGSCAANTATWTIDVGDPLDGTSALTPFHKTAAGAFWTSNDVRDITKLGYTYPELVGNPPNATLVASIKAQYSDAP
ncbi:Di-copper centre-containing protein, partial [Amniculicola lignicola CBS 123094]